MTIWSLKYTNPLSWAQGLWFIKNEPTIFYQKFIGFKRGNRKKVRYKKNFVKIHIELPVREQTCPHCKAKTTKIKDYRTQIIKRTYLYDLKPHYCHTESVDINVSVSTVARLLPSLAISAKYLPEVLCIDEFKGNTGNYKYQVSLMDGKTRKPIDIIECRYKTHLLDYFNKFSLNEQKK